MFRLTKPGWISPELIFLLILITLALFYDYPGIAFNKPDGIHQWRNCVSAAFPLNFYHGGHFLTPQTNALLADHMSSDVTVVEFPLIYYVISLFYRVFGPHVFWHRMFHVFIGIFGLMYLFKASYHFTKDWFYAGCIPLIIFTSPIYAYYLNNFIPDAVALSLSFGGFYYFIKFSKTNRFRSWVTSMCFFLLAGLTKTPSLLPFFGLGGVAVMEWLFRNKGDQKGTYFRYQFKYIGSYLLVLVFLFGWYFYARKYSDAHGGSVSPIAIRPIWLLDKETIMDTLINMKGWFRPGYYHGKNFLLVTILVFSVTLIWFRKANLFLARLNLFIFLGAVSFTLLFFRDMRNHDYYQMNNLFLLITIYLTFFSLFQTTLPGMYRAIWTKAFLGLCVFLMFLHCDDRMDYRNSDRDPYYRDASVVIHMYDIEDYLDEIGVDRTSRVFCTPDNSINISLYYCNRKGVTDYSSFRSLSLEERLEKLKERQIEYVILGSREPYADVENLDQLLGQRIGHIRDTEIFKLEP